MTIFWVIGFALAIVAIAMAAEEVKTDPYGNVAMVFPGLCGFAVFPVLNFAVAAVGIVMVLEAREKRK